MDNDIINTDVYRRTFTHQRARSADERNRRPLVNTNTRKQEEHNRLPSPDSGYADSSELFDRLSPIDIRSSRKPERPRPYERSVASEPADVSRRNGRPYVHVTAAPPSFDSFLPGLNLPTGNKVVKKKRSFLPSLFTGSSTTSLLSPSPQDLFRSTSNHRRGRRHSDTNIHRSIDLDSNDGRAAPPLVRAAQSGSGIEIEELLDQRVDIESRHEATKRTALAVACHCGNDDVVAILLQHAANPNVVDTLGMTPLHLAATRGHYRVVDYLLKEDVNVDAVGPAKKTALRLAADNGHVEVVNLLLTRRAKVNARDAQNITALHSAAGLGDEEIVNLLLSHNADIEAKDGNFQSAIHHASEKGRERIVEILLTKKADIEALGKESMSPLTAACASGSTDVVRLLLQRKASVKHKGDGAMTALHWASYNGHSDVVELLLEKRVPRDPQTNDGRTPLHLAVLAAKFATAELLLRKGASVEATCQNALRPLHYAAECANTDLVQLLLGHNAIIEAETRVGKRPLHYAASQGNLEMIDILLRRGAAIDARDGAGDRALCIASAVGNVEVVRLLISQGAEMRTRYAKGPSHEDSPLCIAAKHGHLAVVDEFVRRGASVRQRDESNWQPLRYAAYFGHPEIVQYLLNSGASISTLDNPGSFGFNLTAERIGFAPNSNIDEFRRQSVLTLLRDAEVREQEASRPSASYNQTYHGLQAPQALGQTFPVEKADDYDTEDNTRNIYQPTSERQELPVLQKSPPQRYPSYRRPSAETEVGKEHHRAEPVVTPKTTILPSRPRSPPPMSQASRLTLDPDSSSQPKWRPVVPPVPAVPRLQSEYFVSPIPAYNPATARSSSSVRTPQVSPLPPQSTKSARSPISEQAYSAVSPMPSMVPQSPTRQPPLPPTLAESRNAYTGDSGPSSNLPSTPARAALPMPELLHLPPIPHPNEAIIVCDDCRVFGGTTTDLACGSCRQALFMYHHIMYGGPDPVAPAASNIFHSQMPAPVYEMA
jgi:ankyrin repeat protein